MICSATASCASRTRASIARPRVVISMLRARPSVPSGRRSKRHVLASSEVYYFISGRGRFTIDDHVTLIEAGTTIYVPPGGQQFVENTGETDIEFLCLVDPAWRMEDEAILE